MDNTPTTPPSPDTPSTVPAAEPAGCVWFVGAGPGAADLLTVRAVRLLESADVVLYDDLVPPHLLGTLRPEVERIPVCRDDPSASTRPLDAGVAVGNLLVQLAMCGRRVVRLKGGDPLVFARFSEEIFPLQEAGIPFHIVPGVTAATAAAAAIAAPLTSREHASSVTLITGHRSAASSQSEEQRDDFARLASQFGTIVVYMGLEKVDSWSQSLLDAGCRGERPVAVISRCSWPDERRRVTTLQDLRHDTAIRSWPSPAIIIVGDVVATAFKATQATPPLPLAGRRVLTTRPTAQAGDVLSMLHRAGAHGLCIPAVEIVPPDSWEPLDQAIREAANFDWIVFSSQNGVETFCDRLLAQGDARLLGTARLAAVGPRTADALTARGLACDLVPATHSAAGLLACFAQEPANRRFLLIQADRGRDTLQQELIARHHHVQRVTAYLSRDIPALDAAAVALLERHAIDWVMLSSPAITESASRLFGSRLAQWKTACNSPAAAEVLRSHGLHATVVSNSPSMESLIEAMQAWESHHREQTEV
jgi:uroporphyrinogen III methyltransferase/synthase